MKTLKGPSLHLAQFSDETAPFNSLPAIAEWAAQTGFSALQIPAWDRRLFDVATAAQSRTYCDDLTGMLAEHGLVVSELTSHIFGQLMAVHPAYDALCDSFAPPALHGDAKARGEWARQQMLLAVKASARLGLSELGTFSGSLAWPYLFPFPQRPEGLIDAAFNELAKRWLPVLNACDEQGINLCYEIHPSEDLHDGVTYEMFLERVGHHPRCRVLFDPSHMVLQQLNYLEFIDIYKEVIGMFHVKDAEFNPTGRQGIYGGYQSWIDRAGRFRSLGDGQVDFNGIFSRLTQYGYSGWATLEWECCLKNPQDGAREGAAFIRDRIIHVTDKVFDDFAGAPVNPQQINVARHSLSLTPQGVNPMKQQENEILLQDLGAEHVYTQVNGQRIHCVIAGEGRPVLLIPGWPQTWYTWRHVMRALAAAGFQAIAVDPPGIGDSDKPVGGYDTGSIGAALHAMMAQLGHERYQLVGHDIGMWIGYAMASDFPQAVERLVLTEAVIPGLAPPPPIFVAPEENIFLWHFMFNQLADLPETLTQGREREYLGYIFNRWSYRRDRVAAEVYIAAYSAPGGLRAGFDYYRAIPETVRQNRVRAATPLTMPVLTVGSEHATGDAPLTTLQGNARDLRGETVAGCGHFITEECHEAFIALITPFLAGEQHAA